MNLIGSRQTLILNICALIFAAVAVAEAIYIEREGFGFFDSATFIFPFFPVFVMFIIRNRTFSCCFLFLYVAVAILMAFHARSIYFGTFRRVSTSIPLAELLLFFLLSVGCLGIYIAYALIRFAMSAFVSRK
jgi:hypothetical protein